MIKTGGYENDTRIATKMLPTSTIAATRKIYSLLEQITSANHERRDRIYVKIKYEICVNGLACIHHYSTD